MGAFQSGFQLGQKAFNDAEDRRTRDRELAMREETHRLSIERSGLENAGLREAAAQREKLAAARQDMLDYTSGFDRTGFSRATAVDGLGLDPSDAQVTAGLQRKFTTAPDTNSLSYMQGLTGKAANYALLNGDTTGALNLSAARRTQAFEQAMAAKRAEYLAMDPATRTALFEKLTGDATTPFNVVPSMSKGPKGEPQYMTWVEGKPRITVGDDTLADLYAAQNNMGSFGDLARQYLTSGNDKIRALAKDWFDVTDKAMGRTNDATHKNNVDTNGRISATAAATQARSISDLRNAGKPIGLSEDGKQILYDTPSGLIGRPVPQGFEMAGLFPKLTGKGAATGENKALEVAKFRAQVAQSWEAREADLMKSGMQNDDIMVARDDFFARRGFASEKAIAELMSGRGPTGARLTRDDIETFNRVHYMTPVDPEQIPWVKAAAEKAKRTAAEKQVGVEKEAAYKARMLEDERRRARESFQAATYGR